MIKKIMNLIVSKVLRMSAVNKITGLTSVPKLESDQPTLFLATK